MVFLALDAHMNNFESLAAYLKRFKVTLSVVDNADITVGGEFCESGRIYVTIFGDYSNTILDANEWYMFRFRLIQTIMHELIHWRQFEKRGHGDSRILKYTSAHEQAAYYSNVDEIVAYSHCCMLEMYREFPDLDIAAVIACKCSETYEHISAEIFSNNHENAALGRYNREIVRWAKLYNS